MWAGYLAALHDLGKCDPHFQAKDPTLAEEVRETGLWMPPNSTPGFRHEARTADWVVPHLRDAHGWGRGAAAVVGLVLRGHHGDFRSSCAVEHTVIKEHWNPVREALAKALLERFRPPPWSPKQFTDASVAGLLLSALVVLADWIASNHEVYRWTQPGADSRQLAEQAIRSLRLEARAAMPGCSFRESWPGIASPRPIQLAVDDAGPPGLCIIEAPTGEGKTEAALALAARWCHETGGSGAYIGLPTAATSNQMHGRVLAYMRGADFRADVRLVHGMAWLVDDQTPEAGPDLGDPEQHRDATEWFRPSRRALLAPLGVGTVDQAMMAALHVRFGFLRLFGLASGVLVIDEIHAYDVYMSAIIARLLRWCSALKIPVILLSATLPASRRAALVEAYSGRPTEDVKEVAYPLVTIARPDQPVTLIGGMDVSRRVELGIAPWSSHLGDPDRIARLAATRVEGGGCLCVLLNTVRMAQDVYSRLRAMALHDCQLVLFHARFTARRRSEIERKVLDLFDKRSLLALGDPEHRARPCRAILVATQVVEQSLDVDFDGMVTELAPIDLLIQRAGRVHRHTRPRPRSFESPSLDIALPPDDSPGDLGSTGRIYQQFLLLKTISALKGRGRIRLPEQTRELIESVYDDDPGIDGVPSALADKARIALEAMRAKLAEEALRYLIPEPDASRHAIAELGLAQGGFDDAEDGGGRSFLHAQTRYGSTTETVLAVEGNEYESELSSARRPRRSTLRDLLLSGVGIPSWWLRGIDEDTAASVAGPAWLHGIRVLRFRDDTWTASTEGGSFVIRHDPEVGLLREEVV